eukprot:c13487_g1_i1.p1 GENE.c13487_g1_i1~~c13487_g1_i1.p1  ORF type:complete len:442 (-),score=90.50 c13487_g1_i1:179-1504(-)
MGKGEAGVSENGSLFGPALGNLHGQYNFQSIAIALVIMKHDNKQSQWEESISLCVVFAGAVFGQLLFGYVGDWLGRNKAMFLTNLFCVIGALGSAVLSWGQGTTLYVLIAIWRFILGMGVGGVYPLSATSAAENSGSSDPLTRRKRVSWAFFWQVPGSTLPFFIAYLLAKWFPDNRELQWRLILGLGAIPAAAVMFHSMGQKESVEFQSAKQEVSFFAALRKREYWGKLIGTGGGWWCYDVVHYGPYLIAPVIVADIFNTQNEESVEVIAWQTCFANLIGVPGVLTCIALYKYMGTKNQQWIGFLFIALSFFLMGAMYDTLPDVPLFFLFCVMTFGINSGPSVTTFVLPSETFPAEVRSTFNGLSAAMGKSGATLITFLDYWLMNWYGIRANLYIYGVVGILGAIITLFFVEDIDSDRLKGRTKVAEEKSINKAAKHTEYV